MVVVRLFVAGVLLLSIPCFIADALYQPTPTWKLVRASWYGAEFEGKPMANGEPFNPRAHTVASRTYSLGRRLLLRRSGVTVEVVVTDRGPFVHGRGLDVSRGVSTALGFQEQGLADIAVLVLAD